MARLVRISCVLLASILPAGAAEPEPSTESSDAPVLARLGGGPWSHCGSIVTALRWSPDCKTIVSSHDDGVIRIWDAQTGVEVRRFTGHTGCAWVTLSKDGTLAASVGNDRSVRIWETQTCKQLHCGEHDGQSVAATFSSDGKILVTAAVGRLHVWDVKSGRLLQTIDAHSNTCMEVCFSPNGREFASCGSDGRVCRWRADTGRSIEQFRLDSNANFGVFTILALAYSPDGTLLALGSDTGHVDVRNLETKKTIRQCKLESTVSTLLFTRRGLAVGGHDRVCLKIMEIDTGETRDVDIGEPAGDIRALALSPDGDTLVAGGRFGQLRKFDLSTLKPVDAERDQRHGAVSCLGFAPDGKTLAWGGRDSPILTVSSVPDGQRLLSINQDARGIGSLQHSPDGRHLAVVTTDDLVRLLDAQTGKPVDGFNEERMGRHAGPGRVAFSHDGTTIWSIGTSGYFLHKVPCRGGSDVVRTRMGLDAEADSLMLSPDGTRLACLADDHCVLKLLSVPNLKPVVAQQPETSTWEVIGAFSPDGTMLATSDHASGQVRLWSAITGASLGSINVNSNRAAGCRVLALAISADRKTLAVSKWDVLVQSYEDFRGTRMGDAISHDTNIYLYEIATHRLRATLRGHRRPIAALAFPPDSRILASGSNDETCILWDLSGRQLADCQKTGKITENDVHPLWKGLLGDAASGAWRDSQTLVAAGDANVAFLERRLKPVEKPSAERLATLIAALDHEDFDQREAASTALALVGEQCKEALDRALAADPTPESKRRLEALLDHLGPTLTGERLRYLRAIEVLEHVGTQDARRLLAKLATGADDDALTLEARASVARLSRRQLKVDSKGGTP